MIHKIFCIHDAAAAAHITPFFMPTEAMAERVFKRMVNDPDHQFGVAPQDYTLYSLGYWDDETGEVVPETRKSIINGTQLVSKNES